MSSLAASSIFGLPVTPLIECAYVFHLFPMPYLSNMERQVVVSYNYDSPKYEVYKPKTHGQFPEIQNESGIFATSHTFQGPGTYVKAYCSFFLSTMDIVGKIFQGQTPVTDTSHVDFGADERQENECLKHIEGLTAGADEAEGLKISRIQKHKSCLDLTLARLAYGGLISIEGTYSGYTPGKRSGVAKVYADRPIDIGNVIFAKQIFNWDIGRKGTHAFAWYMGHLHVFEWFSRGDFWRPLTDIGTPRKNHHIILTTFFADHKAATVDGQAACVRKAVIQEKMWRIV
ncbi:CSEP0349 putative effector protein [Blumeria hordei DH14]|uniref:CSEP0349 putative effector protein n=1 Tax=Blumeria graminis f. sp. hordei (strain DH14) TaxID=546991 RepID=N1JEZ6_BLUG1|nr:CSEP0349 putative effector protein [Blumeria hordei DH14]